MTSTKERTCQNCKSLFTIDASDFKFYEKIQVPPPTFCPGCRVQRRFAFRNEMILYKRKDSRSGEEIFSMFSESAPVKVYEHSFWWSDRWDPMKYGRDIDWSHPFLLQIKKLIQDVPWPSRGGDNLINSEYCMNAGNLKNCYLIFHAHNVEDSAHSVGITNSSDSFDCLYVDKAELCYESVFSSRISRTHFSLRCEDCYNVIFSRDCIGCTNCFGCVNLKHKSYYFFNKPLSKEEYRRRIATFNLGSFKTIEQLKEKIEKDFLQYPVRFATGRHNEKVSGDYIYNSKNVFNSFRVIGGENLRYCQHQRVPTTRDSYDYSFGPANAELIYDSVTSGLHASRIRFSQMCLMYVRDIEYCFSCMNSSDLFGCVGLRNKKYCILNKQYSKESFSTLRKKVIDHMNRMPYIDKKRRVYRYGEFFPIEFSPFGYNETIVQEYFPLTKKQAIEQGYRWKDREVYQRTITLTHDQLPDHISDVPDSILNEIIRCAHFTADQRGPNADPRGSQRQSASSQQKSASCNEQCTSAFRIIPQELKFYRQMNLPLPRLCPNCRHYQRLKLRNPLKLWHRKCTCQGPSSVNEVYKNTAGHFHKSNQCPNEFETSYSPERSEIVYCEQCYLAEVA